MSKALWFNFFKEPIDSRPRHSSDILKVISGSPTDTQPVFDAIARSGSQLFEDANVWVVLRRGEQICAAAFSDCETERLERWRAAFPTPLTHDYINATAVLERRIVDIDDVQRLPVPLSRGQAGFAATGYRAVTITPMLRGDEAIGAIGVARLAPGPLKPKQIALLQTFADQAVIAIENVRLFKETQEALEQQTATAEVLQVISSSVADTQPVFDKILDSCRHLFAGEGLFIQLLGEDAKPCVPTHFVLTVCHCLDTVMQQDAI